MKKYICQGGWVTSKNDGDRHYIPASRLPQLYGIDPSECYFINEGDPPNTYPWYIGLQVLSPRYDGDYTPPKV